jgi:ATP-dependent Clp protease ATP-binding subunit ClpC
MLAAAKAAFLPEFLNRIDEVVTFEALAPEQIERIAGLICERVAGRLAEERGIVLEVAPELVARLARDGFDEAFGARPLQRHVRRTLEKELTRAILDGRLADGAAVTAALGGDGEVALRVAAPAPERVAA